MSSCQTLLKVCALTSFHNETNPTILRVQAAGVAPRQSYAVAAAGAAAASTAGAKL